MLEKIMSKNVLKKIAIFAVLGMLTFGGIGGGQKLSAQEDKEKYKPFWHVLNLIRQKYVDEKKIKEEDLVNGAIKGIMSTLDPHSQYLDPEEYNRLKTETKGEFGGLGIEIAIEKGVLTIISPIDDTPAQRAGVRAGDKITAINGESTEGITIDGAVKKLRGVKGTPVTITILREGLDETFDLTITRDIIKIKTVRPLALKDNIGYVKIRNFAATTTADLQDALKDFKNKNVKYLILDLRYNPGGLLEAAVGVASHFIKADKLVVSTKSRVFQDHKLQSWGGVYSDSNIPMAVLINKGSASASEIVAGAVQDHKRGIVIGTKSYGKASVQSLFDDFENGAALKLTTAHYYTPNDRLIHEKGIDPDIVVEELAEGKLLVDLIRKEAFLLFAEKYTKEHPDTKENFDVDDKILGSFVQFARGLSIEVNDGEVQKDKNLIRRSLAYEILKGTKGKDIAEKVILESYDEHIRRAIEVLKVSDSLMHSAK